MWIWPSPTRLTTCLAQAGRGGQLELTGDGHDRPAAGRGDTSRANSTPPASQMRAGPRIDGEPRRSDRGRVPNLHRCNYAGATRTLVAHRAPTLPGRHGARHRHRSRRGHPPAGRRPAPGPPRGAAGPAGRGTGSWPCPLPEAGGGPGRPVERLWSHQAAAIDLARAGRLGGRRHRHRLGQVALLPDPDRRGVGRAGAPGTSLLLFPTKALAQDQLRAAQRRSSVPGLVAATYDGDTGPDERTWARANANVVLTNPEMLHHGVLPHHDRWATFLMRLRYVVVDELHVLRGVFGTHVAHLLRRLRRLCAHYGSDPTFVFSSATIGAARSAGLRAVRARGRRDHRRRVAAGRARSSRCGTRPWSWTIARPGDDARASGRRPSANRQTAAVMAELIGQGHRTIAFCRSRKGTELVAADVRRRLPAELADRVRPYRGGYLAGERRRIEDELFGGHAPRGRRHHRARARHRRRRARRLRARRLPRHHRLDVAAGGPGRARDARTSVVVLVAGDDQLDQWLMSHPDQVFSRPPEPAVINPANPYVLNAHLACAAYERPLGHADERWWPDLLDEGVRALVVDDRLKIRPRRFGGRDEPLAVWSGRGWPAHAVGLRNGSTREVRIALADGTLVGTVDQRPGRAHGAPGRHLPAPGPQLPGRRSSTSTTARPSSSPSTAASGPSRAASPTSPSSTEERPRQVGRSQLRLGRGAGAPRRWSATGGSTRFTGELLGTEELFLPPGELTTRAFWYTIEPDVLAEAGIDPGRRWPAPCTPSSTPPSACCRCSPSATGGTSAVCRPRCSSRRAGRRS